MCSNQSHCMLNKRFFGLKGGGSQNKVKFKNLFSHNFLFFSAFRSNQVIKQVHILYFRQSIETSMQKYLSQINHTRIKNSIVENIQSLPNHSYLICHYFSKILTIDPNHFQTNAFFFEMLALTPPLPRKVSGISVMVCQM